MRENARVSTYKLVVRLAPWEDGEIARVAIEQLLKDECPYDSIVELSHY